MNNTGTEGRLPIITTSFLIMGNVLGVGVLALPIKCGLGGFFPALISIVLVWAVMLVSAWVIAYKINLEKSDSFHIPSFYGNALGRAGKWVAMACNLILLYGVLVAYLGGISTMVYSLAKASFHDAPISASWITIVYFSVLTAMILFGMEALRKGNMVVIAVVWISFFGLVFTGVSQFGVEKLAHQDWKLMVVGLPVAVTASYMANGAGLFGFIRDMTVTYLKKDSRLLVGYVMLIVGAVVLVYVAGDKLGIIDLIPPDPSVPVMSSEPEVSTGF